MGTIKLLIFAIFDENTQVSILKITKEIKAALIVLSAIALLIFGYNFLKGNNLLTHDKEFYAYYDNVDGLDTASKVTINGYHVGKVQDIAFADDSGKLKVTFTIESDFKFGANSKAQIYSASIIGGKSLAIIPESNPSEFAESGATLVSDTDQGMIGELTSKIDPISDKLERVLGKVDTTLTGINRILSEENTTVISKSLADLSITLNSFKATSARIDGILVENEANLNAGLSNFKSASSNINDFSKDLAEANIEEITQRLNQVSKDVASLTQKVSNGNGTAGKFINDPAVYDNLDRATRQLDMLLQDLKLNPKRYVHFSLFGKRNKEYKKPKDSLK